MKTVATTVCMLHTHTITVYIKHFKTKIHTVCNRQALWTGLHSPTKWHFLTLLYHGLAGRAECAQCYAVSMAGSLGSQQEGVQATFP